MNAEIRFLHQHVGRFLNLDAIALRQVLAKNAVKPTVDVLYPTIFTAI